MLALSIRQPHAELRVADLRVAELPRSSGASVSLSWPYSMARGSELRVIADASLCGAGYRIRAYDLVVQSESAPFRAHTSLQIVGRVEACSNRRDASHCGPAVWEASYHCGARRQVLVCIARRNPVFQDCSSSSESSHIRPENGRGSSGTLLGVSAARRIIGWRLHRGATLGEAPVPWKIRATACVTADSLTSKTSRASVPLAPPPQ